jgi:hypothetical protein
LWRRPRPRLGYGAKERRRRTRKKNVCKNEPDALEEMKQSTI